jgi:hypothetical protein
MEYNISICNGRIGFVYHYGLICVLPCIIKVGKVNMEHQLDATITVLLIS